LNEEISNLGDLFCIRPSVVRRMNSEIH
jgi:hypothetical protein